MGKPAFDTDFVGDNGTIITAKTPEEHKRYTYMGYKEARVADIRADEIRKVYDNWQGAAATFGNGVLDAIPFAQTAITKTINQVNGDQAAEDYAAQHENLAHANPVSSVAGQLTGGAAILGMAGVGASGATTLAQMGHGAAVNIALGAANHVDRASLAHAVEPAGEEKIWSHFASDLLFDGVVGAAPAALSKMAKSFAGFGEVAAKSQWRQSLVDADKYAQYVKQGRSGDFGQVLDQYAIYGETPAAVKAKIKPDLKKLEGEYNALKSQLADVRMGGTQAGDLVDRVGTLLGESHPELATKFTAKMMEHGNAPNLGELHNLRQSLDQHIDFGAQTEEAHMAQLPLFEARKAVNQSIGELLGGMPTNNGAAAQSWQSLDKQYSNLMLLQDGLARTKAPKAGGIPWYVSAIGLEVGMPGVGKVFTAYKGAQKMAAMFKAGEMQKPAEAFGKIFTSFAGKMAKATEAGLLGAASETTAMMHADASKDDDYDLHAAQVRYAAQDQIRLGGNLGKTMAASGAPSDLQIVLQMKALQASKYLMDKMPVDAASMNGAGSPTTFRPPPEVRAKWLGIYNSIKDPSYALLNPTRENMDVLKQFYPAALGQAQTAIADQLRNNTELPLEAHTWASRVMGFPTGGLTSPIFYQIYTSSRQAAAQKNQPQGKPSKGGQSAQSAVSSEGQPTNLEKLQTR